MKLMLSQFTHPYLAPSAPVALAVLLLPSLAIAAPCSEVVSGPAIYGAGGSAVTPTLGHVAAALQGLNEEDRLTILFYDPGACAGYGLWRTPDPTLEVSFKYWDAEGMQLSCEAPQSVIEFTHMGNTPALCPGDVPLPEDAARFVAPVQTVNIITHIDSQQDRISAEALNYIFGFAPGAAGKAVAPWVDPNAVFVRKASSFVHQLVAGSVGVPAASFQLLPEQFLNTNQEIVNAVDLYGDNGNPEVTLGYVSGGNATAGEVAGQIKSLAYQHSDQTCAYLPDSSSTRRDKINVRSGQYWLWTPAWFYSWVDEDGVPLNDDIAKLIGWFDASLSAPEGIDIQEIIVESGDVPLCAMQAMRPDGDLSPIQSYAPNGPCNGWYEYVAAGSTDYQACDDSEECENEREVCRQGFCEAY